MWEPYCILCGFGRMRRQEEWIAHMAGHTAAERLAADNRAEDQAIIRVGDELTDAMLNK